VLFFARLSASRPVSIRPSILKSLMNDQNGWPKVAGVFFSSRKWPVQANPYAIGIQSSAHQGCPRTNAAMTVRIPSDVPHACMMRLRGSLCWSR